MEFCIKYKEVSGEEFFTRASSDRTRSKNFELREGRFRLEISKKLLTVRVVRSWSRLPREAEGAPSLEVFQAMLGGAQGNLI